MLTTQRTLARGAVTGIGSDGVYRALQAAAGEPRVRRLDAMPGAPQAHGRRSLACLVHLTDVHTVDVQSPVRYEFMERLYGGPESLRVVLPAQRPHEALNAHAMEALVRTINNTLASPDTGAPVQLLVSTGDNIDNQQGNELALFLQIMCGPAAKPNSGGPFYEGVQSDAWEDPAYWHPDPVPDDFKQRWGFPTHAGLLQDALSAFFAHGSRLPWISGYGNHDALILGAALTNGTFEAIATGDRKAALAPPHFEMEHLASFIAAPEELLSGPAVSVTPDSQRHTVSRAEYLLQHRLALGTPHCHGFLPHDDGNEGGYYVNDDLPGVRLVMLDTNNPGGGFEGSIGAAQLGWLEERLHEVHSRYFDAFGQVITGGGRDSVVIVCTHHPAVSMSNDRVYPDGAAMDDLPRCSGTVLEALLHRFPNVVLWLNGHIHRNVVWHRPDPTGRAAGYWEVSTASVIDWPSQARLVELVSNGNGTLSILCTMLDHDAPITCEGTQGIDRLAALHRELAANDPHAGVHSGLAGSRDDRNVELVLPAPFPLD